MATYHDSALQPQLANCELHLLEEQPNQLVDDEFEAISHKLENDKPAAGEIADLVAKAEQGCRTSQFILGEWYQKSQDDFQNSNTASKWYEKAALQGHVLAQYTLGLMFQTGDGVPQDYIRAAEWFEEAAKQGYVAAQNSLGSMYRDGLHVAQNLTKAVHWFRKLAQKGYADSQYYIAHAYQHGDGVTQDYAQAFKWYTKATKQGNLDAQIELDGMYHTGKGFSQDFSRVVKWYTKAAKQGNSDAQFYLGLMYQSGHGVDINYTQASEWYAQASAQGHAVAQNHLEAMNRNEKDIDVGVITDQKVNNMIDAFTELYPDEVDNPHVRQFLLDLRKLINREIVFPPHPLSSPIEEEQWYNKLTTNLVIGLMKTIQFLKKPLKGLKKLCHKIMQVLGFESATLENTIEMVNVENHLSQ